jgi:hypothetical protein
VSTTQLKNSSPMSMTPVEPSFSGVKDADKFWLCIVSYGTCQISDLSDTKTIRYQIYQIPNLSDYKPGPSLSDTKPNKYQTHQIPNLPETEPPDIIPIKYLTDQITFSVPSPFKSYEGRQPLLACTLAKLGLK